ncbi:unnamed protein product, partial [Darwinula stevensoni]
MPSSTNSGLERNKNNLQVIASQHYKSGPPVPKRLGDESDEDKVETTTQEEWVTSRKVQVQTTKQVETRVQRQVVLEDGKVVDDTGPHVTTNTTADVVTTETEDQEHRKMGDDPPEGDWVAIPGSKVVSEKTERKTNTREEKEDFLETEKEEHLGDVAHNVR